MEGGVGEYFNIIFSHDLSFILIFYVNPQVGYPPDPDRPLNGSEVTGALISLVWPYWLRKIIYDICRRSGCLTQRIENDIQMYIKQ